MCDALPLAGSDASAASATDDPTGSIARSARRAGASRAGKGQQLGAAMRPASCRAGLDALSVRPPALPIPRR